MTDPHGSLAAYALAVTALTLTPGVDTALVLRTASLEDRRQAGLAALGIAAGCLAWGGAVALGLAALLAVSELGYELLRYLGAGYLFWLGATMLANPGTSSDPTSTAPGAAATGEGRSWFLVGFAGNILNPKVGIFYVSFLPQFIPPGSSTQLWTMGLVAIHVLLGLAWSGVLIAIAGKVATRLQSQPAAGWMDRITGTLFVGFAAKLALSRR